MNRIEAARAEVARIETEIDGMGELLHKRRDELAALRAQAKREFDPDILARISGLETAITQLSAAIPKPEAWQDGEGLPQIGLDLEAAKQRLAEAIGARDSLNNRVEAIEEFERRYGADLAAIVAAYQVITDTFNRAGWPAEIDERRTRAALIWARDRQHEIARLPNWRQSLAELGE